MTHRWNRPSLSCKPCREKKRRCDRNQPCSNCAQRNIQCEYAGQSQSIEATSDGIALETGINAQGRPDLASSAAPAATRPTPASLNAEEVLHRLLKLEEAVFAKSSSFTPTPFSAHLASASCDEPCLDTAYIARHLPPVAQGRDLFKHFAITLGPVLGILHVPYTKGLLEQTYQSILEGMVPDIAKLLLLLSIFAGSVFAWTPQLLVTMNATPAEAKAASTAYTRLSIMIMDHPQPMEPSTTIHMIRYRCLVMAKEMQFHRLDSPKSRAEREKNGYNTMEIEVQRRVWWNMVAPDWLNAFAGGSQEGAYNIQPRHMMVDYPSNVDDDLPLSQASSMSGFIHRVKLATLCREEPEYETILALDENFFRLDPVSIQESQDMSRDRPYIPLQRITLHFGLHTRLCRLHRPYHLEGVTNPKYAYSHQVCIRSAQTVLELRRAMDDAGAQAGLKPSRFWTVMQHIFLAALILATDVSFNPNAPDAEDRKTKVLAAYDILERSKKESSTLIDPVQKNMQILMSTLQKQSPQAPSATSKESTAAEQGRGSGGLGGLSTAYGRADIVQSSIASRITPAGDGAYGNAVVNDAEIGEGNWDQLWFDFLAIAPELDAPQWNVLLDDIEFNIFEPKM
ncbi:hypothetical protein BDV29DRAFT_199585 [Aspergillus leporis]|uniref:Zn(2)-C6 fungal-type domain-containing protein n=1 Tax=Aspergillus leporis TaxID=41062 RepID=A0A5N5WIU7_9EURO|nr:hypothetical protein BDV29DRAFT_199585 [Aspergillus leporis]